MNNRDNIYSNKIYSHHDIIISNYIIKSVGIGNTI